MSGKMHGEVEKSVLITGGSGGIGYRMAELFASHRRNLILAARDEQRLDEAGGKIRESFPVEVQCIAMDLSRPGSARELYSEIPEGSVDVLINNAGFSAYGEFSRVEPGIELEMMNLNMISVAVLTRLFLREMVEEGEGRIMNVSSLAAFNPGPMMSVYSATKAFVLSLTLALAEEVEGTGVNVCVLCPGPTRTGFARRAGAEESRLFTGGMMDSTEVARQAYRGLNRGKRLIIPGLKNRVLAQLGRFLPRSTAAKVVKHLSDRKES